MIGDRLLRGARDWFDEATIQHVFEPLVADWQRECADATGVADRWRCRVRGNLAFATAVVVSFPRLLTSPLPAGLGGTTWLCLELWATAGAILVLPLGLDAFREGVPLAFMLPAALALGAAIAMAPAAVWLLGSSSWPATSVRRALLRTTTVLCLGMVLALGWIVPWTNQSWRETAAATLEARGGLVTRPVLPTEREITIPMLLDRRRLDDASRRAANVELSNRASIAVMPLAMLVVGLALAVRRGPRLARCALAWTVGVGVWLGTNLAASVAFRQHSDWGAAAKWAPVIAVLVVGVALHGLRRSPVSQQDMTTQ